MWAEILKNNGAQLPAQIYDVIVFKGIHFSQKLNNNVGLANIIPYRSYH